MIGETLTRVKNMPNPLEDAFVEAFDTYADALFRHACFRVGSRERATDLSQEAFIKTWDYVRGGGEVRHWKSFLYHVLNNLIIDSYRKAKEESLDALLEYDVPAHSALVADGSRTETENRFDEQLLMEKVRAHIPRLPETYRLPVTLRYVDGFSPKEIAALLNLSENVVSVRIHRGVAQLRKWCAPLENL